MKLETMDWRLGLAEGRAMPFALIRSLSCVTLGKTPLEIEPEELLEARFFDETHEIRLFWREGTLCAARLSELPGDKVIREDYDLEHPQFGGSITVCRYLDADEDGQTYVSAVRLAGWREKNG